MMEIFLFVSASIASLIQALKYGWPEKFGNPPLKNFLPLLTVCVGGALGFFAFDGEPLMNVLTGCVAGSVSSSTYDMFKGMMRAYYERKGIQE